MKKHYVYALAVIALMGLLIGGYYFYGPEAKNRTIEVTTDELVARPDLGFSFRFPSGEDALAFTQSTPDQLNNQELLQAFIMMDSGAQQEFLAASGTVSTPPSIAVFVFERGESPVGTNPDGSELTAEDKLRLWAESHESFTGISGANGIVESTEIDGAPAIRYYTDAQYRQQVYITRYTDKIYIFVGQYHSEADYIYQAFTNLVQSVVFE